MNTQTLQNFTGLCNFSITLPDRQLSSAQPIQASSRDYGFDFEEDQLARELLAPLPIQAKPEPRMDEDTIGALWFLS